MSILSSDDQARITHAVSLAENRTSGEIRIVVEQVVGEMSASDRAAKYFADLGMHKTARRNGVLIYLALVDRQFAIIGDIGIHGQVEEDFWECTKEKMLVHFRAGDYVQGLVEGIVNAGDRLHTFFPKQEDDINELPNEIHFGAN